MSRTRLVYTGRNGRRVGVDLEKVEAILDEGDGQVDLLTSSQHYRIVANFDDVVAEWKGDGG